MIFCFALCEYEQQYRLPRAIQAGRVWVNCYHLYPAHAPFGGYKKSGFGREVRHRVDQFIVQLDFFLNFVSLLLLLNLQTHKMMLDSYRQTKNMLISYDKNKLGFF